MQNTPNFNFMIAEGTDTVNLLTQCYPNFTSLDSILQGIKETGVTTATATKTGTNFAVVRTDTDCNFFRFVATANYVAGDTFTVDGVPVTATSAAGAALASGAFVINQSVLCVLNSAVLTVFAGGAAGNIDAADVDYDNTVSGLTATDVQSAIDEVVGDIPTGFAATAISYDNSASGLTATNAQDAIDELASSAIIYSTTERVVGKWVDGITDVYEKTVVDVATTEAIAGNRHRFTTATLVSGVSRLISFVGVAHHVTNNIDFGFGEASFESNMSGGCGGRAERSASGDVIAFHDYAGSVAGGVTITATIRYLKQFKYYQP